jgi:iduronate 2-sulfatase
MCRHVVYFLVSIFAVLLSYSEAQELQQTNLLMIMFDDLRPELSFYGRKYMITPNLERLAAKSVIFDYAFCQVAVCNPSRDSLLTGLRPDTVGTYNFGHSWENHLVLPAQLVKSGYNTAGIGKIFHWETDDRNIWSFHHWDNKWYDYQGEENRYMNSSTMPDKVRREEDFRDAQFTERALSTWKDMLKTNKPYMLALGYKLPHLAIHIPHKYYQMYKGRNKAWKLNKRELRFPYSSPEISYRCCAEGEFRYMREEGALPANRSIPIGDINQALPEEMHDELMHGYVAGVTFLDTLIGKLLDFMDEQKLWETTTVVLTSDHGMHNGEKGIW